MDYRQQRITGVEALIRWKRPDASWFRRTSFIPLAEQNGSILAIGEWVLEEACRQLAEWRSQGLTWLRVAVNLSTAQLHHPQLPTRSSSCSVAMRCRLRHWSWK